MNESVALLGSKRVVSLHSRGTRADPGGFDDDEVTIQAHDDLVFPKERSYHRKDHLAPSVVRRTTIPAYDVGGYRSDVAEVLDARDYASPLALAYATIAASDTPRMPMCRPAPHSGPGAVRHSEGAERPKNPA